MKRVLPITLPLVGLLLASCSSVSRTPLVSDTIAVGVLPDSAVESIAAVPVLPAGPTQVLNKPRPAPATIDNPTPIWRDAEIMTVDMEAFLNEKGELIEPGRKHVVRRPGGWNMEAMKNPSQAYIPAENLPAVPAANANFTGIVSPGYDQPTQPQTKPAGLGVLGLVPIDQVRVTGFRRQEDRARAAAMAKTGEVLIFDPNLGYLLVPQAVLLMTPVDVSGANRPAAAESPVRDKPASPEQSAKDSDIK